MAATKSDNSTLYLVIGGLLLYDKIFGKSKEEAAAEQKNIIEEGKIENVPLTSNPFDYQHYKPKVPASLVKSKKYSLLRKGAGIPIRKAASDIKYGWSIFNDDESKVINGFKTAKTKPEIALLAQYYSFDFKKDLAYDIKTKMSPEERVNIYAYINKLPEYIPLK
jgi:hypothetical protein